jgi:integral membrane sensor domain MASE1
VQAKSAEASIYAWLVGPSSGLSAILPVVLAYRQAQWRYKQQKK